MHFHTLSLPCRGSWRSTLDYSMRINASWEGNLRIYFAFWILTDQQEKYASKTDRGTEQNVQACCFWLETPLVTLMKRLSRECGSHVFYVKVASGGLSKPLVSHGAAAASIVIGLTTASILFCSHFHQMSGDKAAGKMSPIVRLGSTSRGLQVIFQASHFSASKLRVSLSWPSLWIYRWHCMRLNYPKSKLLIFVKLCVSQQATSQLDLFLQKSSGVSMSCHDQLLTVFTQEYVTKRLPIIYRYCIRKQIVIPEGFGCKRIVWLVLAPVQCRFWNGQ